MDDGVLCLKWRDHRSTFLRMLSSIRKKGVFCDATLACEGRFYPVHRLVLSTCSEYFQHMFEVVDGVGGGRAGGALAGPLVVVLADILPCDLEALLEYMYAGEATIMQGDLSRFMRAAEGLKVRGLAEPPPQAATSTPRRESGEGKRPLSQHEDTWEAKRRREDVRPVKEAKEAGQEIVSPAQLAAVELAPEAQGGAGRGLATAAPGDHPGASAPNTLDRPQVKCEEEVQVKEEPEEWPQPGSEGGTADGLLAFSDPGLAYLAHTSGLGGATADPSPPQPARSHPPQQHPHLQSTLQPTPGWEAAGPSDTTFPQQPPGPLRAATQIPVKEEVKEEGGEDEGRPEAAAAEEKEEEDEVDEELLLTRGEQRRLLEWLTLSDELGFSRLREDVLRAVPRLVAGAGRAEAFPAGQPDQAWYSRFLRRHPGLALRLHRESLLLKSVVSRDSLQQWYSSVEQLVGAAGGGGLLADAARVFSAGVVVFPADARDGAVFEPRAANDRTPRSRSQYVSVVGAVSAAGAVAPGTAVFPEGLRSLPAAPGPDWHVTTSPSGTVEPHNFLEHVSAVLVPWLRRQGVATPVLVFLHGRYNALVTPEVCRLYRERVVVVHALHPRTLLHGPEPVVAALTEPLARAWAPEVQRWRREASRSALTAQDFLPLVSRILQQAVQPAAIQQAFLSCGLFPFQPPAPAPAPPASHHPSGPPPRTTPSQQ